MPSSPDRSPFNRPRWTEQDARDVLAALRRSGKPVRVFAAAQGLDPQRVYLWRRRLGGAEPTTFQELIVRPAARRAATEVAGNSFEIVLASGDMVRVPASFDGAALARLLEVLTQVVRAEFAAERATVRRNAARRRTQGARQSHGARSRRAPPRSPERSLIHLLFQTM
jgi:hypothetical protein